MVHLRYDVGMLEAPIPLRLLKLSDIRASLRLNVIMLTQKPHINNKR